MNYYVEIKHPITGERIVVVPTGKTRQTQSSVSEAEGTVISPGTGITNIWFTKQDLWKH